MVRRILSVFKDKRGVSALEYSVLAGLVVVAVAAVYQASGLKAAIAATLKSVVAAIGGTMT